MKNNGLKKVRIKNHMCCYFDDITKLEDLDIDNILIDENHMKILWFMTFYIKLSLSQSLCKLGSIKKMDLWWI